MFANIHSHLFPPTDNLTVCNLNFMQAERLIGSNMTGLYSIGIHPCNSDELSGVTFEKLVRAVKSGKIFALGECGLDKYGTAKLTEQIKYFEKQINLSELVQMPLIIHCVGRFNELLAIRKLAKPQQRWIIHGFRGKPALAEQLLAAGCSLSFGEKFNLQSVQLMPTESLFVETDESKMPIDKIYLQIANVKSCKVDELTAGTRFINSRLNV